MKDLTNGQLQRDLESIEKYHKNTPQHNKQIARNEDGSLIITKQENITHSPHPEGGSEGEKCKCGRGNDELGMHRIGADCYQFQYPSVTPVERTTGYKFKDYKSHKSDADLDWSEPVEKGSRIDELVKEFQDNYSNRGLYEKINSTGFLHYALKVIEKEAKESERRRVEGVIDEMKKLYVEELRKKIKKVENIDDAAGNEMVKYAVVILESALQDLKERISKDKE